jgi:hypothetical protein
VLAKRDILDPGNGLAKGFALDIRVILPSRQRIVLELELELELELGAVSQTASAATRVQQSQILTTPTPAIEDEDEFEDDFLYLVPQFSGTTRTKLPSSLT